MEIETLNAMNDGMTMIRVIALITVLFAVTGLVVYLAGIAWLCFEEKRRIITRTRTARRASPPNNGKSSTLAPLKQLLSTNNNY